MAEGDTRRPARSCRRIAVAERRGETGLGDRGDVGEPPVFLAWRLGKPTASKRSMRRVAQRLEPRRVRRRCFLEPVKFDDVIAASCVIVTSWVIVRFDVTAVGAARLCSRRNGGSAPTSFFDPIVSLGSSFRARSLSPVLTIRPSIITWTKSGTM